MSRPLERALLGSVLCVCALTLGIVAWPGYGPTGTLSVPDGAPREQDPGSGRHSLAIATSGVERPESRSQAPSKLDSEVDTHEVADAERATISGRVVLADGSPASGATVWSSSARSLADADGNFELAAARTPEACQAVLPGFQPAEARRAWNGITLQLGPPTLTISGRIRAEQAEESQGWRIALLDATLIDPVGIEAATHESATSRAPARVQSFADGSFAIDGLSRRPYTLAAWRAARERIELFAASPAAPGEGPVEILIPPPAARRTIELRCIDETGVPQPNVRVGLPGTPATAATDRDGRIVFTGALPAQLTLVLVTLDGSVLVRVVDLASDAKVPVPGTTSTPSRR